MAKTAVVLWDVT